MLDQSTGNRCVSRETHATLTPDGSQRVTNPPRTDTEDGQEAPLAYDTALANRALARLRQQISGNGVAPINLTIKQCEGSVLEFYGATHLALHPEITESKAAGRASSGDIVSVNQGRAQIQEFLKSLTFDASLQMQVAQSITARPDKGFGLHEEAIPFPVEKTIVEHHPCTQCNGGGQSPCPQCHGKRQMVCYKCAGTGTMHCIVCRGSRVVQSNGQNQPCYHCQGRGMAACDLCRGSCMIGCSSCGTQGFLPCQPCGASGVISHIYRLKTRLLARFELRDDKLPATIKNLFQRNGVQRLVASGDMQASPLSPEEVANIKTGTSPASGDFLYVPYRALLPYAVAHFELQRNRAKTKDNSASASTFKGEIVGYNSKLMGFPSFMDSLLKAPLALLTQAARGEGIAAVKIKQASKWRSIRQALVLVLKGTERGAMQKLLKANPIGLSKNCATAIVKTSNVALKKITRKPRYIALCAGLVLNFGLLCVWFAKGARIEVMNALGITQTSAGDAVNWPALALDIALIPLLTLMCIGLIRYTGHYVMRKSLGDLGLEQEAGHWPKAGTTALYAWLCHPVFFIVIIWFLSPEKPQWVTAITGGL